MPKGRGFREQVPAQHHTIPTQLGKASEQHCVAPNSHEEKQLCKLAQHSLRTKHGQTVVKGQPGKFYKEQRKERIRNYFFLSVAF